MTKIQRYRERNRLAGLCLYSKRHEPAAPGKHICQPCLDKQKARNMATYHNRQSLGLCPQCGKQPPMENWAVCGSCILKGRRIGRLSYLRKVRPVDGDD